MCVRRLLSWVKKRSIKDGCMCVLVFASVSLIVFELGVGVNLKTQKQRKWQAGPLVPPKHWLGMGLFSNW